MKTKFIRFAASTRLLLFIGAACILSPGFAPSHAQVPNTLHDTLFSPATRLGSQVNFGYAVAATSSHLVVGAPEFISGTTDIREAFVYDAVTGALLHRLVNPEPQVDDKFGGAVAISGTRVVIATYSKELAGGPIEDGTVYVYDLASATPTVPQFTINNPLAAGASSQRNFGKSVALSGNRLAVGATGNLGIGDNGVVYYFDLTSATPTVPVQTILPAASNSNFGYSVALEGTRLVIAAPRALVGGFSAAGQAFVYEMGGATPTVPVHTINNPTPTASEFFGASVSLSGNRVVIGASQDDTGAAEAGLAYVYDITTATPTIPAVTLNNPAPTAGDIFGAAVFINGSRVLVDAFGETVAGNTNAGAIYVYDLNSATPSTSVLTINNPSPSGSSGSQELFGSTIAVVGDRAWLGAANEDPPGATNSGVVYFYDLAGVTPATPLLTVVSPVLKSGDLFGQVVAASGSRAAVVSRNAVGTDAGEIYLFDLSSATPTVSTGTIPRPTSGGFGNTVGLSGNLLVSGDQSNSSGSGSAFLFDLGSGTPFVPARTYNNPTPVSGDQFGFATAVSGTRVVVAAPLDDTGASNAGEVYVYDNSSGTPSTPLFTLPNPSPAADDNFGLAVVMDGNRVVVSVPADDTGATDAGTVYVFDLTSGTPTVPVHTLNNPAAAAGDKFGASLAIAGAYLIIGAPDDDAGATDAGTAYAYNLASATPTVPFATLTNPGPAASDAYGFSVAISGTTTVIGTRLDDAGATNSGTAYVYDVGTATPTVILSTLNNPTPASGDNFGAGVAISGTRAVIGAPSDDTLLFNKGAAYVYGLERPEIAVEHPVGTNIADGGTKNYGTILIGAPVSLTYTLKNTGTSDLTGITISKDGTHAAEFHILQNPAATVIPGGSTTFIVRFTPVTSGSKTAALHLTSNDFDEGLFDINLAGAALSNVEDRDNDGMNDFAEFQLAPQGFDLNLSQPALVSAFYAGANSAGLFTPAQVQALYVDTPLLQKNPATGQFKLTLRAEKSTNLVNFAPFPFTAPATTINGQGEIEFLFTVPDNAAFFLIEAQ